MFNFQRFIVWAYSFFKEKAISFYKHFQKIYVYEITSKKLKKLKKLNYFFVQKYNSKSLFLHSYFRDNRLKIKRFNHSKFVGIKNNNTIVCSGWIAYKKTRNWLIEEIDSRYSFKNAIVLYDFRTHNQYMNQGFYFNLLKFIQNKFLNKRIIIYTLSTNLKSIKIITKSKFNRFIILKKNFF